MKQDKFHHPLSDLLNHEHLHDVIHSEIGGGHGGGGGGHHGGGGGWRGRGGYWGGYGWGSPYYVYNEPVVYTDLFRKIQITPKGKNYLKSLKNTKGNFVYYFLSKISDGNSWRESDLRESLRLEDFDSIVNSLENNGYIAVTG